MSRRIEYTPGQTMNSKGTIFVEDLPAHRYPGGGTVRQATFLCPVCKENTFSAFIKDVKAEKTWRCKDCKGKNSSERFSKVKEGQRYGFLTVISFLGVDQTTKKKEWLCKCDCGTEVMRRTQELRDGKSITCATPNCPYHQIVLGNRARKDLTGKRFGMLYVKSLDKIEPYNTTWICDCDCGNKNVIFSSKQLLAYNRKSCGCLRSKGETRIQKIFDDNNISYQKEKTFEDCLNPETNHHLRFDFYLTDYNCCIEYDGQQHYVQPWNTNWAPLEEVQEKDNIKTQYCKDNNIKLIRIPYTDYDKLNLKYLLEKVENIC